ncbi:Leucine-rich repeat protein kinase family protein [Striga hermonthica]|uniref:Leucine-rich repeat protein kinase family protein n=1 Tax=Striga hermonthica TaxID=68872 RepID=A0A9N7MK71_STRHE|nr:Leucine-rich repeat protein kinase family protein [Striga hermonthica]
MDFLSPFLFLSFLLAALSSADPFSELTSLLDLKSGLDPENRHLSSWVGSGNPCGGTFEGVACNEKGQVANISLQGKGLAGKLSPAVGQLRHLTGLYLHYNSLYGEIPVEIANLTELSDLYLNVNNFSGEIPPELGGMQSLQVLQLCYNQLTGSIPTQLGHLNKLNVLALQSNLLAGAIPASLGSLGVLMRLDLSFNRLFGSIPTKLADAPLLEILDVRNNSLSGNVPLALKRLVDGFRYENNLGLCGTGFSFLKSCSESDRPNSVGPDPYPGGGSKNIPETANLDLNCTTRSPCSKTTRTSRAPLTAGLVVLVAVIVSTLGIASIVYYRRRQQKLGSSSLDVLDSSRHLSRTDDDCRKNGSPLVSLEYTSGWDPLAEGRRFGGVSQDAMRNFRLNLQEVESATQYFAEKNMLGRSNYAVTYKGTLRDGSAVAVKRVAKSSCRAEEAEFLKGLTVLTSLGHENVVVLRGFCCSRGRGECFLVYDYLSNGSLYGYLDLEEGDGRVLEWSARVSVIKGVAKGIEYLHGHRPNKPPLVHQNISARNILLNQRWAPSLSDSCLHKLLTNDIVFSSLKASAAMGYLAPEYTTTGRFTDKSDVYAFGALVFQVLSGKRKYSPAMRAHAESCTLGLMDPNLGGRFCEREARIIVKVALMCTHEHPEERPSMGTVLGELDW